MRQFAGVDAHTDAKMSFSSQTKTLVDNYEGRKIALDAVYVEASRIKRDLQQYNAWDSSWRPVGMGGWYSYNDILDKLNRVINELKERHGNDPVLQRVIAKPVHPVIESNCEDKALEWFGFWLGKSKVAQATACHPYLVGGAAAAVIGLVVLLALTPYANLASQMLSMRGGRKSHKRRKRRK